jgi:hypothetical protein
MDCALESKQPLVMTMRALVLALLLPLLLANAACATRNSIQGGATDDGGVARVKIGIPF